MTLLPPLPIECNRMSIGERSTPYVWNRVIVFFKYALGYNIKTGLTIVGTYIRRPQREYIQRM